MAQPQPLPLSVTTGPLAAYNGYVYTVGGDNNLYKLSTTVAIPDGSATPFLDVSIAVGIQYITINFNATTQKAEMYISAIGDNQNGNGKIYLIPDLDNPVLTIFVENIDSPRGLQVDNGYLYVVTVTAGITIQVKVIQFDLANSANQIVLNFTQDQFGNSQQLVITGDNLYILNQYGPPYSYIGKVNSISTFSSSSSYDLSWVDVNDYVGVGGSPDKILVTDGTYLYFSYYTSDPNIYNYMGQIDINTATVTTGNYFPNFALTPNTEFYYTVIYNSIFYIDFYFLSAGGDYDFTMYNLPIYNSNITCFKKDTKILTDKGYISIQDLRKGDLVKTLRHDYKAIDMIGKRDIYHSGIKERIKDQLYECSKDNFVEIFEPLIITGCHSILVDNFTSEEQKQKVIEVNGKIYITDNKYRVPAFTDHRASVYEISGTYTIYHLALENDNYYMNYGIYANGLLVETCSKRYLKELSNMTLIE
jgi:hypothetical protein